MTSAEFSRCIELYSVSLFRFLFKKLKDESKAKDMLQDTYVKLWENLSEVESINAKSYMFTIAYHAMIDQMRRDNKSVAIDDLEEDELPEMTYDLPEHDFNQTVLRGAERLPEQLKTAVILRDLHQYSYEEIAVIMKLEVYMVKTNIYRARKYLKKYLVRADNLR